MERVGVPNVLYTQCTCEHASVCVSVFVCVRARSHAYVMYVLQKIHNHIYYNTYFEHSIYSLHMTYDPGYDEYLHPGEGGGRHPEQLRGVVLYGHVREQFGTLEAISCIHHQQAQEDGEGSCMGHELQEGTTHYLPQLRRRKKMNSTPMEPQRPGGQPEGR